MQEIDKEKDIFGNERIFEKVRIMLMLMQNSQENINYQKCCWEIADIVGKAF